MVSAEIVCVAESRIIDEVGDGEQDAGTFKGVGLHQREFLFGKATGLLQEGGRQS